MKRSLVWRVQHIIHNCVAHPLLPLAEHLLVTDRKLLARVIFRFHDLTTPADDPYNKQRFF